MTLANRECLLEKNHCGFNLDEELTEKETAVDLTNEPKLYNYMKHGARERQLLLCWKLWKEDCTSCEPICLLSDMFE